MSLTSEQQAQIRLIKITLSQNDVNLIELMAKQWTYALLDIVEQQAAELEKHHADKEHLLSELSKTVSIETVNKLTSELERYKAALAMALPIVDHNSPTLAEMIRKDLSQGDK